MDGAGVNKTIKLILTNYCSGALRFALVEHGYDLLQWVCAILLRII
jgi:hypothetical protein